MAIACLGVSDNQRVLNRGSKKQTFAFPAGAGGGTVAEEPVEVLVVDGGASAVASVVAVVIDWP